MSLITVSNLRVKYDTTLALDDVSLTINDGEFIGIIGPNGGGKTTLVKSILRLVQPDSGHVTIDDEVIIGYVPQRTSFELGFPISVQEVILTGHLPKRFRLIRNLSQHERHHAVSVMKRLGIYDLRHRQIGALSGGQLQRVLIGRAMMNHPNLLVLDEPVAGVDAESKEEIYKLLIELNQGMTILLITHHLNDMEAYFDRVVYINQKIHIHEGQKKQTIQDQNEGLDSLLENRQSKDQVDQYSCPIDWYEQGRRIQEQLTNKESDQ